MNDLLKKKNKYMLILGETELYIKYIESILYYALETCEPDSDIIFFTIDSAEKSNIYLKKYKFVNNKLITDNRGKRKISNVKNL